MVALYVRNGVAFVWDPNDWYILRTRYRICGAMIGATPAFPRQNDYLGLPMELMAEEAALLVDIGVCNLYEMPNLTEKLNEDDKRKVETLEQISLEGQMRALRNQRIQQLSQKLDIIVAGKKKKLISKGETSIKLDKQVILQEEINKLPSIAPGNILVHLPVEHHIGTGAVKVGLNNLHSDIPDSDTIIRYAVFKNLWERGYHITNGSKFGADYLVYPGDPVKFHATYMIRCINDSKMNIRPLDLIAFGRLAVSVNKLAVIACCNSSGEIEYQTIQWQG